MNRKLRDELVQILREALPPAPGLYDDMPPISTELATFIELWANTPQVPINTTWQAAIAMTDSKREP